MDEEKMIPLRQFIESNGLEPLRGKPIRVRDQILYIHNQCLDSDIALYADEPHMAKYINRFYGGESPNCKKVVWIYTSQATTNQ